MDQNDLDDRAKLLGTARAILARGDAKFSIAMLCAEAGVTRDAFRGHFTGKAALLAELMAPVPAPEPGVALPDAWLERRLRVFERALNALEVRAEATARDQARAIAALEEKLLSLGVVPTKAEAKPEPAATVPEPAAEEVAVLQEIVDPQEGAPVPLLAPLEPEPLALLSRAEMADVLQAARGKARPVPEEPAPKTGARLRWLAIGALSLATLFLCAGLTLGDTARATSADLAGSGTTPRRLAPAGLARTIALADAGDARARVALSVAYLRGAQVGEDTAAAVRWSVAAARDGHPVAQYVLGTLYGQGTGVTADPVRAFDLFSAAAARGNLKAMHNLAIAYAEGLGTEKDEAKAAEWFARAAARGYVDSAFDLGVLHERGLGVAQDLKQALKWYGIAALAGDAPAQERADFLTTQLTAPEAQLAANQARGFTPLPALESANRLPAF
ncbi:MAG: tetratricopeptide repeat protein [Pseudomonadota bacterium]